MSDLDVFRTALERIAASADVPLAKMPDFDQPNGWRDLAIDRINIARAALASATCNSGLQVGVVVKDSLTTGEVVEPPSVNAQNLWAIRDAIRAYEGALTFTPAASADFRAGVKAGFNGADMTILGLMNSADRGSERLYEPYPGAFDGLFKAEGEN